MNAHSISLLSPEQIDIVQRAVAEVASTGGGFGIVAIVIEKGEPRRVQQMKDYFLKPRPNESSPPLCSAIG